MSRGAMNPGAAAWPTGSLGMVTATIDEVAGARVQVSSRSFGRLSARVAVVGPYTPRAGDTVLVAMADGAHYVVGVLRALRGVDAEQRSVEREGAERITAEDGSSAALEQDEDGPVWRLRDPDDRLVFEHRPGRSVVYVREDLSLSAGGDVELSAAGEVRIHGGERVALGSDGPVELRSEGGASALALDGDRTSVSAGHVAMEAQRADVKVADANVVAKVLRTVAERVRERADVVERTAGRVVERAREVFRDVEELSQTRAGRLKLVAETALTILGTSTMVKAREEVKVTGEKIYLG